jgi:hypothetical protein
MYTITKKLHNVSLGTLTFNHFTSCMAHLGWCMLTPTEVKVDELIITGPMVFITLVRDMSHLEASRFVWTQKMVSQTKHKV